MKFGEDNTNIDFDKAIVDTVMKEFQHYCDCYGKPPKTIGLGAREYDELKKAERAGYRLSVRHKNKTVVIPFGKAVI